MPASQFLISNLATSGPYRWTYGVPPVEVGVVQEAPEVEQQFEIEPVTGDNLGATIQDGVYRGGNTYMSMVFREFNSAAVQAMLLNFSPAAGQIGFIGGRSRAVVSPGASRLVGQAIDNPGATPEFYRFEMTQIDPGSYRYLLASRNRDVPLRLLCLPFEETDTPGVIRWFRNTELPP